MEYGVDTSMGAREYMEDFYSQVRLSDNTLLVGVFDGHGGDDVASYCANNLLQQLSNSNLSCPKEALIKAFLEVDDTLKSLNEQQEHHEDKVGAGSTAVVAVIERKKSLVVANVGDSRAILSRLGKAQDLAKAHEPEDLEERSRIEAADGRIMPNGYLSNADESCTLAMSRSIGDFEFKMDKSLDAQHQMVIAVPDIVEVQLTGDDEFLILTSDGIWMDSQAVVDLVQKLMKANTSLDLICKNLIDKADANDNMTAIIIKL